MGVDVLPQDLLALLSPLKVREASRTRKGEEEFRVLVLMGKTPSVTMDAAEISKRVEQALSEEKMRALYAAWMQRRLAKDDIRISPAFEETLLSSPGEAVSP
jgi:hypothetical protein